MTSPADVTWASGSKACVVLEDELDSWHLGFGWTFSMHSLSFPIFFLVEIKSTLMNFSKFVLLGRYQM